MTPTADDKGPLKGTLRELWSLRSSHGDLAVLSNPCLAPTLGPLALNESANLQADINYAYRQLSRALHPDKNPDIEEASGREPSKNGFFKGL